MQGSAQHDEKLPSSDISVNSEGMSAEGTSAEMNLRRSVGGGDDHSNGSRILADTELGPALQLLVERAQYITGATGTALALPQGEEMVCRASAGSSAPAVGARLQVRSGLTGESIARRQLLRCDNAEIDPRVNLEACRALGIASIVVLPLLRRTGEVRGLFELFSDHPYAFEERDLIALERMADLTLTALDLAEQPPRAAVAASPREPEVVVQPSSSGSGSVADLDGAEPLLHASNVLEAVVPVEDKPAAPTEPPATLPVASSSTPVSVPEAMLRVQKCASCGFPVSEGRALCLDCEKKDSEKLDLDRKRVRNEIEQQQAAGQKQIEVEAKDLEVQRGAQQSPDASPSSVMASAAPVEGELVPAFLANSVPASESWLANHVNLLAIVVLIVGILVAVVVFR